MTVTQTFRAGVVRAQGGPHRLAAATARVVPAGDQGKIIDFICLVQLQLINSRSNTLFYL